MGHRNTKKKRLQGHARLRAYQRFNMFLTQDDFAKMAKIIQSGIASFVEKQSNRVSIFDIECQGKPCRVVYDKKRKTVITFLYKDSSQFPSPA